VGAQYGDIHSVFALHVAAPPALINYALRRRCRQARRLRHCLRCCRGEASAAFVFVYAHTFGAFLSTTIISRCHLFFFFFNRLLHRCGGRSNCARRATRAYYSPLRLQRQAALSAAASTRRWRWNVNTRRMPEEPIALASALHTPSTTSRRTPHLPSSVPALCETARSSPSR